MIHIPSTKKLLPTCNPGRKHTGIGHGDDGSIRVAEPAAERRHGEEHDRAGGGDDARVEVGGTLAGGPAQVAEGLDPEVRGGVGHFERYVFLDIGGCYIVWCC